MLDPQWSSEWDYKPQGNQSKPLPSWGSSVTRVPMWVFVGSDGTRVVSSLPVEVEVGREGPDDDSPDSAFVFNCKKLHVFASGSTYKDAEDQFHEQVVHFFREYRDADHASLADDAAEIQVLYNKYFQESSPSV
jgi:hypothetical protein